MAVMSDEAPMTWSRACHSASDACAQAPSINRYLKVTLRYTNVGTNFFLPAPIPTLVLYMCHDMGAVAY